MAGTVYPFSSARKGHHQHLVVYMPSSSSRLCSLLASPKTAWEAGKITKLRDAC